MPKRNELKKVLVIGSGPIVIGQAAEFDYAGTQALEALNEEGIETVLINSNPATIMTDQEMADKVYIEPLTAEYVKKIILKERPDGLLASLGGQTGLNLAKELAESGVLAEEGVELLGTKLRSIIKAEDREEFRSLMHEIAEPIPESVIVNEIEEALVFASEIGYPLIVRPAYTLGGSGGGIASNEEELKEVLTSGLKQSPINQCLVERSIAGFKEIEYEVMRDKNDNCIVVCNMENFDPVGVHTGDSIVVAPSQTLADQEYQMLRSSSLKIIRELGIEGGCNVQYALDPHSFKYYVIEVNPRVSRSSALASKATGYPIAKMAAKIAIGYTLDELQNPVTKKSYASFEPALDYIVSKIPRWPFDKFVKANRRLGTQMKATGEVMAIGRTFEESILKAVRSLEIDLVHLALPGSDKIDNYELEERIRRADDERIFLVADALRRGITIDEIHAWSQIDKWFLNKLQNIINMEQQIKEEPLSPELLYDAKRAGFTDYIIAALKKDSGKEEFTEEKVREFRLQNHIVPTFKMVDTCAAEFEAATPYYYSTYEDEDEVTKSLKEKVLVLGSGPIRIGQGIEFDYATVHAVRAIQEAGYEAVIINNNPETVSTDFSISDRLYFEPLFIEDVMNVIEKENPIGVIVQFGGQTAINLAKPLADRGIKILGTSLENIDRAENRKKFEELLKELYVAQPLGTTVTSVDEAVKATDELGFPVVVRPSYVLGGRAMEIVYNKDELLTYMQAAVKVNPEHPVLIDRYMIGREMDVDAISDGKTVIIPGIMEHIERAGVHSGDSIAVYPPQTIYEHIKEEVINITEKVALALDTRGLINIQFVISQNQVYVIEVNPRSSRTVPFLSKVTDVPMANIATKVILGESLESLLEKHDLKAGYHPESEMVSVKAPVFSFAKLDLVEVALGPEMKSTGEVMGKDRSFDKALYKALIAAGMKIPHSGTILATVADKDKEYALKILKRYNDLGFKMLATSGTADMLAANGIQVKKIAKLEEGEPNIMDVIKNGEADLIINTITKGKASSSDGFKLRREAVEKGAICITSLDTAHALLKALETIAFSVEALPEKTKKKEELAV